MLSILIAHNYYRSSSPSGEDVVFEAEAELLSARGHVVHKYVRRSDDIAKFSFARQAALGKEIIWSQQSYLEIKQTVAKLRPDVAHFHNTFPLISVSAYRACRELGVPVVQTLHNYRLLCLNGELVREGDVCESCLGKKLPWPGLFHRCYRNSFSYSAAMAAMQFANRMTRTWTEVDLFIAPSEFLRQKYVAVGFPPDRIRVKPHFTNLQAGPCDGAREYALFVGRLSPEKGVRTLIAAWKQLPQIPLTIVGDGPQAQELRTAAEQLGNVTFVGAVSHADVVKYVQRARYLVVPSEWYENLPMVIIEAFACGTPVIASNLGALPEVIMHGRNGLLFKPKDPTDLVSKAAYLWAQPQDANELGREARLDYETRFTPERNHEQLLKAYAMVLEHPREDYALAVANS